MHACLLLLSGLRRGEDPVVLKEINVTLPANLADVKFQGRNAFPDKRLGYSVAYGNTMCKVTLYVYDFGVKEIPDGKANDLVKDQLKRSIDDLRLAEKKGYYQNVQAMKEPPLPKTVLEGFDLAGFTFDIKGGGCKSYILLTARNNQFVKVRITQYVVDNKTNDTEVSAFLTALAEKLKPAK